MVTIVMTIASIGFKPNNHVSIGLFSGRCKFFYLFRTKNEINFRVVDCTILLKMQCLNDELVNY